MLGPRMRIGILSHERMATAPWNDRSAESLILTDGSMSMAIEVYRVVVSEDLGGMQKKYLEKLDLAEIAETLRRGRVLGSSVGKE